MQEEQNNEAYNIISFVCFLVVVTPILLILYWGADIKASVEQNGMVKVEAGKLFIKNKRGAEQNAQNQTIILAETLNRHTAELAIQSPGNAYKLKNSSPQLISTTINSLSANPPNDLLKKAGARSIKWSPTIGSHGLFVLDYEKRPSKTTSFGLINLPGGKEKSTFLTEKRANKLLYELNKLERTQTPEKTKTIESVVSDALRTRPPLISPEEAVELIGLCYGLNLTYNKDLGLFASHETIPEIMAWKSEIID